MHSFCFCFCFCSSSPTTTTKLIFWLLLLTVTHKHAPTSSSPSLRCCTRVCLGWPTRLSVTSCGWLVSRLGHRIFMTSLGCHAHVKISSQVLRIYIWKSDWNSQSMLTVSSSSSSSCWWLGYMHAVAESVRLTVEVGSLQTSIHSSP